MFSLSSCTHFGVYMRIDETLSLEFLVSHRTCRFDGDAWQYVWTSERLHCVVLLVVGNSWQVLRLADLVSFLQWVQADMKIHLQLSLAEPK